MKNKLYLLLLLLSLLPLLPLFSPGLPITHDGRDHVARIANFSMSLYQGNLIPRWAGNLNWGYGHPILMFLYPLSSYFASFFIALGISYIASTKLVFALAFIASGLAMFLWLQRFLTQRAAFIGALIYLFAPYRFVDLYVRGAIGEHMAFVFPPLILYFMQRFHTKKSISSVIGGSLSLAGLILSHNAVSLMFLPIIILYGVYLLLQKWNVQKCIAFICMGVFGFSLSAFFWIPAFFEGKYTLRDIVITQDYAARLYPLIKFIYSPWSFGLSGDFSLQVGLFQWLSLILGIYVIYQLRRKKNHLWLLGLGAVIGFFGVLFLMIPPSLPIWKSVSLLQKFQFPWRFLTLSVFFSCLLGALVAENLIVKKKMFFVIICIGIILSTIPFWKVNGTIQKENGYFSQPFASTTDTGESAPIWSVRFMEAYPKSEIEVIGGQATIQKGIREVERHTYLITATSSAQIRENTLYFPGWKVFVDGKETEINFQDTNNRGVMTFMIGQGKHLVEIIFTETKLRHAANVLSLVSLCLLMILSILNWRNIWRPFR